MPRPFERQDLPPPARPPAEQPARPAPAEAAATAMSPAAAERVFCEQAISLQLAAPNAVPAQYRPFVGVWSDAAWTPSLCAALIVESVMPDGTATVIYAYGPMAGGNPRGPAGGGGVLRGTGIIRDGQLRFQNADGSQFAFRPQFADLDGRLTTPQGQSYAAIFKKAP
jgi:hypothetical protein